MYNHILVPTDGSEAAQTVAETGMELANHTGATLHVLYVLKTHFPIEEFSDQLEAKQQTKATEIVEEIATTARSSGLDVTTQIKQGVPYRQILKYSDAVDIDLVVMGTHGRTGASHYLLGSTTEKVVRMADIQVLTAHPF